MSEDFDKKVKLLLVGPVPPPFGGIPAYVKSLLDTELENVEFILFNTANPTWIEPVSREGKRNYASIFEFGIWASIKKVAFILGTFLSFVWYLIIKKPVVVQVFTCSYWGYWRNWIYVLIAKFFGKKTIFHLLGAIDLFYSEVGKIQRLLLRKSLNSADCYLMQSPGLETWAKSYSHKTVIGIWNGIDFTQIPPQKENPPEAFASLNSPIGLTVGNLSANKGTPDIIKALRTISDKNKQIGWVFVGRGDLQHYKILADQAGLSQNIYFAGEVSEFEKWQYLHYANFFCLPSYAEGQPISIIEAMACGLPVISTKVGSIPEMISDGLNGKLITPGDTDALVSTILEFVQNPELIDSMGKASYKVCQERHNIADLFAGLSKVYFWLGGVSSKRENAELI